MSNELRFDGKVAIVTGAGGALGASYALLLAQRGAAVVVNDLGAPMAGAGSDKTPAQKIVNQITSMGGKAVADYNSVEDGDKIVETAIKNFGRLDILINNAGVLRDVAFAKMTKEQWSTIEKVHLYGAFKCTKAAWPHMMKNKFGRIIMTSSASGVYGNFGQSNYSAAKLALVGFANSLAKEGQKNNVFVNTICPVAGSRMTETVMPPDLVAALSPNYVAPVVGYLCHESCTDNGGLFELGGGWVSRLRWQRTKGHTFPVASISPDSIKADFNKVLDFTDASNPDSVTNSMEQMIANLTSKL